MSYTSSPSTKKHLIPLIETRPVVSDIASAAGPYWIATFRGRLIGATGVCRAVGGSTPHTDVDLSVFKGASTLMIASVIPVVNSSAVVKDPAVISIGPSATVANTKFNKGDVINLGIDITGGSSPESYGVGAIIEVEEEESAAT